MEDPLLAMLKVTQAMLESKQLTPDVLKKMLGNISPQRAKYERLYKRLQSIQSAGLEKAWTVEACWEIIRGLGVAPGEEERSLAALRQAWGSKDTRRIFFDQLTYVEERFTLTSSVEGKIRAQLGAKKPAWLVVGLAALVVLAIILLAAGGGGAAPQATPQVSPLPSLTPTQFGPTLAAAVTRSPTPVPATRTPTLPLSATPTLEGWKVGIIGRVSNTNLLAWSPDGSMLAVGEYTKLNIFDAATLEVLHELHPSFNVRNLAWSPDGRQIAVAGVDILGLDGSEFVSPAEYDYMRAIRWTSDGTLLQVITYNQGDGIAAYDPKKAFFATPNLPSSDGLFDNACVLIFSPDGRYLAVAHDAANLKPKAPLAEEGTYVLDLQTAQVIFHAKEYGCVKQKGWLIWSADSQFLLMMNNELLEPQSGQLTAFRGTTPGQLSAGGSHVAYVDKSGQLWVETIGQGAPRRISRDGQTFGTLAWSPQGSSLAALFEEDSGGYTNYWLAVFDFGAP